MRRHLSRHLHFIRINSYHLLDHMVWLAKAVRNDVPYLSRRFTRRVRHFTKLKRNRRRMLYTVLAATILFLLTFIYSQAVIHNAEQRYQQQQLQSREKSLRSLTQRLQDVQKLKADSDSQLQQKAAQEGQLKAQIDDLNNQLQTKRAQQATVASASAVPTPSGAVAAASLSVVDGCGDNVYAHFIYTKESGCNLNAVNSIGCRGIGQACPGSKLPCGADYACQNAWFTNYANSAYGGWAGAYAFWLKHSWW